MSSKWIPAVSYFSPRLKQPKIALTIHHQVSVLLSRALHTLTPAVDKELLQEVRTQLGRRLFKHHRASQATALMTETQLYYQTRIIIYQTLRLIHRSIQSEPCSYKQHQLKKKYQTLLEVTYHYPTLLQHFFTPLTKKLMSSSFKSNLPTPFSVEHLKIALKHHMPAPQIAITATTMLRFLQHCVFLFRAGINPQPLITVLVTMENSPLFASYIKKKLCDKPVISGGEIWKTGMHEWLPRCLIYQLILSSAGLLPEKQTVIISQYPHPSARPIDWLELHLHLRSPIKGIFYKHQGSQIIAGHVGALKRVPTPQHKEHCSKGDFTFHRKLVTLFNQQTTLNDFVTALTPLCNKMLVTIEDGPHAPAATSTFTSRGLNTASPQDLTKVVSETLNPEQKKREQLFKHYQLLTKAPKYEQPHAFTQTL